MCPIVSACGMATYQLAKFLTKILQRYTGITPSFVKDSKREEELVKKFNHLQQQPRYRNMPVPDIIRKKWVINLSSKPLSDGEQSILQKGPKFAVSSSRVPITKYIAVTK